MRRAARADANQAASYSDLLKDPRWQRLRLLVFEYHNWRCEVCDSTEKTLHAHHLRYVSGRMPWEYKIHELACLCFDCHGLIHERENTGYTCCNDDISARLQFIEMAGVEWREFVYHEGVKHGYHKDKNSKESS